MATPQTLDIAETDPFPVESATGAARREWILCAKAVCARCRFGHPAHSGDDGFYHDVNVGTGVFPHRCEASAIWQLGEPR